MRNLLKFLSILLLVPQVCFGEASRSLDGVSDTIDFTKPASLTIGTDSFTRMVWFYWTQGADTSGEVIFSQQDGTGTGRTWLEIDDNDAACVGGGADSLYSVLGGTNNCGTGATSTDVWTHVAVVSDEGAGTVIGYKNGVQEFSATRTVEAATGSLRTGVHKTATDQDFEGQMAYSILCEGVLSASQINNISINPEIHASAYCGAGNYLTHAPFWGTSPEQDISGNGNTGTVTGAATSSNGPPVMFGGGLPL